MEPVRATIEFITSEGLFHRKFKLERWVNRGILNPCYFRQGSVNNVLSNHCANKIGTPPTRRIPNSKLSVLAI